MADPIFRISFHLEKVYVGTVGESSLRSASLTSVDKSACISRLWFLNYGGQLRIVLEGDEKRVGDYLPCLEKVNGYANHYVASTTQQVADVFKALVSKCEIPEEARKVFDFHVASWRASF
jgi:hypothetical protein